MLKVSVFSFKWFEAHSNVESISPVMATLDAISRMNGSAIEATRMEVEASRVDHSGVLIRDPGN